MGFHNMHKPQVNWELCQVCESYEARLVCKVKSYVRIDPGDPVLLHSPSAITARFARRPTPIVRSLSTISRMHLDSRNRD